MPEPIDPATLLRDPRPRPLSSQMEGDAALAEHRLERALKLQLVEIDREARDRAAPVIARLAALAASRPPLPVIVPGDSLKAWGARLRDDTPRPPYSRAEQLRQAVAVAFADEPLTVQRWARDAFGEARDATLDRLARLLKG